MGRGGRKQKAESSHFRVATSQGSNQINLDQPAGPSASGEMLEIAEELFRASTYEQEEVRSAIVAEALLLAIHDRERPSYERASGLAKREGPFRLDSPLIRAVANDPRFAKDLQIMVDLDSTLFPLDGALREMGVHFRTHKGGGWGRDRNDLGDAIMRDCYGRDDLCEGGLSEEEMKEYNSLLVHFFDRMHSSPQTMINSGVFEYAPAMLRFLSHQGIGIHLFTHRTESSERATLEWLGAMDIPYDSFKLADPSRPESESDKIAFCQQQGIGICIDDKPQTIQQAEEAGIEALTLDWPYTREVAGNAGADAAACWREIGERVIEHVEQKIFLRAKRESIDLLAMFQ